LRAIPQIGKHSIDDLKRLHKRRAPKMFYDYAESGSWTEQTFRENTSDFDQLRIRQRVAVDMTGRSTKTQMIGQDVNRGCGRTHEQAVLVSGLYAERR